MKEKLRQRIIELIHGVPYEEALKKEQKIDSLIKGGDWKDIAPITIGRVMQALHLAGIDCDYTMSPEGNLAIILDVIVVCCWKLTKENGQECTLDDQSEKTTEELYSLLK